MFAGSRNGILAAEIVYPGLLDSHGPIPFHPKAVDLVLRDKATRARTPAKVPYGRNENPVE